ncbi:alpha-glucosidase/alpha-galactosidase [Paenibacillus hodogayensis]
MIKDMNENQNRKLVLIGAGSSMFTQGLVADLLRNPGRFNWHLALVDTDPRALDSIAKLCGKMISAKEGSIRLTYSTDRRDVLDDADYVVCTIGVGGRRAWEQDVFIPRQYGVYQPVGDTAMPGGISRAMRMIPAMVDIVRDVMKQCPNATFFNYSNPMTMICRALSKATDFPVVGLCHGVHDSERHVAQLAGLDLSKFTAYSIGINHLTFMYDFRYDGQDARPLIRDKIHALTQAGIDFKNVGAMFREMGEEAPAISNPYAWSFFEQYGAYAAPGDRHVVEFFPERFPGAQYYGKTFGKDAYSFEKVIAYGDRIYDRMDELGQSPDPLPDDFFDKLSGEHEQLMEIIDSIENDKRHLFSVNVQNRGAVPNLPRDAVIELPGAATARGIAALQILDYPDTLAQLLAKPLAIVELTVDAALRGDRNLFVEAVLLGGYLNDRSAAEAMVDEMIAAQKQYLPQFQ